MRESRSQGACTSFAAPRMEAIAEKILENNPTLSGSQATIGIKCVCDAGQDLTPNNVKSCNA